MKTRRSRYHRHRFPAEIISHAVWLYHHFCLSFRDVEDLLAGRSIIVSYETIRHWCQKFGPDYAQKLKRRQGRLGDTWHLDELFLKINGELQYLWRAVDQDGDVIEISWCSQGAINMRLNDSFKDYCEARANNRFESLPTSSKAIVLQNEPSCPTSLMTLAVTPTIVLRCRINRLDTASGKCAASNLLVTRSDFCPHIASSIISFEWGVTD